MKKKNQINEEWDEDCGVNELLSKKPKQKRSVVLPLFIQPSWRKRLIIMRSLSKTGQRKGLYE